MYAISLLSAARTAAAPTYPELGRSGYYPLHFTLLHIYECNLRVIKWDFRIEVGVQGLSPRRGYLVLVTTPRLCRHHFVALSPSAP